ncbi:MAG: pentapeptide repeat-containing protein [Candidatus Methanofastidiosia archaeon]
MRCSYTWPSYDKEKKEYTKSQCPKKVWESTKKYCIFHDLSKDKDIELFRQKLNEKLKKKNFNFQGYYFPEELNFSNMEFNNIADFTRATFQENINFTETTFQKNVVFNETTFQKNVVFKETTFQDASFDNTTFQKNVVFTRATFQDASFDNTTFQYHVDFEETTFQQNVSFDNTTFQKNVMFDKATFQDASFDNTTFQKNASFNKIKFRSISFNGTIIERNLKFKTDPKQNNELNLQNAQFLFKGYITANLTKAKFYGANLENVVFNQCEWPKKLYEEVHMKPGYVSLKDIETIYRNLKQSMHNSGNYSKAGEFFYKEMEIKRKIAKTKEKYFQWLWLEFYRRLAGYGEHPENTVIVSFSVILVFALFYRGFGCLQYTVINSCLSQQIIDVLYFSFVTFTTLGLGDIRPMTSIGKMLVCLEAIIGAFLIALFVVGFFRKMAR